MVELIVEWLSVFLVFTYQYFPQLNIHISFFTFSSHFPGAGQGGGGDPPEGQIPPLGFTADG